MPISNKRFYQNYDKTKLTLTVDRRGFLVGTSRLGFSTLQTTPPGLVDVLANFTNMSLSIGSSVVDGAWIQQEASVLTLNTRDESLFETYDGEPITLKYDVFTLFDGYIESTVLSSQLNDDLTKEEVIITVVCRAWDAVAYQLPPVNGALRVYGTPENPGSGYTTGRPAERVWERANAITGSTGVGYAGRFANALIDERLAATSAQEGNQGSILQDLAIRSGTIADLSGTNPLFRTYQDLKHWQLDDTDVTSYSLATDRESPNALILTRAEDNTDFVAYQGAGNNSIEREVGTWDAVKWGLNTTAGLVPLKKTQDLYLSGFTVPFSAEVPLQRYTPYKVTFSHTNKAGIKKTYRGAATRITHSIGKDRWLITAECEPVHLITRRSDVFPSQPEHFRGTGGVGSATLNWSTDSAGVAQGGTTTYVVLLDGDAANVDIGDQVQVYKSDGTLRDPRIFTVTTKPSAFGYTNVTLNETLATASIAGDTLRFPDYGAPAALWRVYYRLVSSGPNFPQCNPLDGLSSSVFTSSTPSAVITMAAGTYYFSVFAFTADGFRSGPSRDLSLVVT